MAEPIHRAVILNDYDGNLGQALYLDSTRVASEPTLYAIDIVKAIGDRAVTIEQWDVSSEEGIEVDSDDEEINNNRFPISLSKAKSLFKIIGVA